MFQFEPASQPQSTGRSMPLIADAAGDSLLVQEGDIAADYLERLLDIVDYDGKVKLIATETAVQVSEQAIRIHGGAGIMREYPVGRIHRDALVYVIGEGTSDIQRNIIARQMGFKP